MTPEITLVAIPTPVLRMLSSGDLASAGRVMGMAMPPSTLDSQWIWSTFVDRIVAEPEHAFWRTQYFAVEDGRVVGDLRMHRPPDRDGAVTLGYQVVPVERGRGVATAATAGLIDLAARHPEVRIVAAQVSPTNAASLAVCRRLGFVDVGEEWHALNGQMMRRFELSVEPA